MTPGGRSSNGPQCRLVQERTRSMSSPLCSLAPASTADTGRPTSHSMLGLAYMHRTPIASPKGTRAARIRSRSPRRTGSHHRRRSSNRNRISHGSRHNCPGFPSCRTAAMYLHACPSSICSPSDERKIHALTVGLGGNEVVDCTMIPWQKQKDDTSSPLHACPSYPERH